MIRGKLFCSVKGSAGPVSRGTRGELSTKKTRRNNIRGSILYHQCGKIGLKYRAEKNERKTKKRKEHREKDTKFQSIAKVLRSGVKKKNEGRLDPPKTQDNSKNYLKIRGQKRKTRVRRSHRANTSIFGRVRESKSGKRNIWGWRGLTKEDHQAS